MKDLKHYFVSPKGSVEQTQCDLIEKNRSLYKEPVVSSFNRLNENGTSNDLVKVYSKKKKRKRKSTDFDDKPIDTENFMSNGADSIVKKDSNKKRKKSDILLKASNNKILPEELVETVNVEKTGNDSHVLLENDKKLTEHSLNKSRKSQRKSKRILITDNCNNGLSDDAYKNGKSTNNVNEIPSKNILNKSEFKKRDSNSSKENSLLNSESEEKEFSTPENTKSLLNYFSKVDKLPEIEERPRVIKVEAMVHVPKGATEKSTPKSIKKRKSSKRRDLKIDYDLITSEEIDGSDLTNLSSSSQGWQMRIQIADESNHSSDSVEIISETIKEEVPEMKEISKSIEGRHLSSKNNDGRKRKLDESNHSSDNLEIISETIKEEVPEMKKISKSIEGKHLSSKNNDGRKRKLDMVENEDNLSKKRTTCEDDDVIFVDKITVEKPKVKNDGTLASFFQLGKKMPSLTAEQKSAKQQFLNSGVPESIKRITAVQSNFQGKDAPYPEKSHIQQKDKMNIMWNLLAKQFNFCCEQETIKNPEWSNILPKQLKSITNNFRQEQSLGTNTLKDLKKELNLYPISCWYKELKRLRKGKDNNMWTERYRPHLSSSFLANTRSICQLKAWLTELKEHSHTDSCESSSDEFVKNDESGNIDKKTVALLSGLPGTGKTAAVYAVAEEIGYHVLEINASYNRSGKRILNEFSEAMQSHKVGVSKLNFSKVKKKIENPKRSLILVEDADLLFEDDEGFVSTLINLASGTKRPIILVVNNSQVKHLNKLATLCHASLHFTAPSQDRLGSWLRTVSEVEGFSLSQTLATELASTQDIRRSLLQLQFSQEKASLYRYCHLEESMWGGIGEYDFTVVKERKKAKQHISSLATLDIIKKSKGVDTTPYWQSLPEDSTMTRECEELSTSSSFDDYESYFFNLMNVNSKLNRVHQCEIPRNLNEIEKTAFSVTNILSRRNNAMDFWPTLRQISRNEAYRLASHTKRNNRYFNYLSSVGISGPPDFIQSLSSTFTYLPQ